MNQVTDTSTLSLRAFEEGFDPIEDRLRANIRSTTEPVFEEELDSFPGRLRDSRHGGGVKAIATEPAEDARSREPLASGRSACPAPGSKMASGDQRLCRVTSG